MFETRATSGKDILFDEVTSFLLVTTTPPFLLFYWVTYHYFSASLTSATTALLSEGISDFFLPRLPQLTWFSILTYSFWVLFQATLYLYLPGSIYSASRTPGGRQLQYKLNGLNAWIITVGTAVIASYYGMINPAVIAVHWADLLVTANAYSLLLVIVFQIKARVKPDNTADTLLTGYFWYDLFNGGELHPRNGNFDWKHFNASRSGGILAWSLIDLSFAALQYQLHGSVTNSMILVVVLRTVVIAEYFWVENSFLESLDTTHERFSFYNIFGFVAVMPMIWTLQTQYLAYHPIELSWSALILNSAIFSVGWALSHYTNGQRALCRETGGNCTIWGQKARYIEAKYETTDGRIHRTQLLCSGWWGIARHANYMGSILYSLALCGACGTNSLFPYTEVILVVGLTVHRCFRDEARCKVKYGKAWEEYCRIVKWRMIPGIF